MKEFAIHVLRTIGLPEQLEGDSGTYLSPESLRIAKLNKIELLYLETLERYGRIGSWSSELNRLREKQQRILDLACFLGEIFEANDISYTLFKTLKPFPFSGADADVLIETPEDFSKAAKILRDEDFVSAACLTQGTPSTNVFSTTLFRKDFGVNVDLQVEVAVSNLPYITKNALLRHVVTRKIQNYALRTLDTESEITVAACHAFYKEHMFTLADFYNVVLSVKRDSITDLGELTRRTKSNAAVVSLLLWAEIVAVAVFGINLINVNRLLTNLGGHPLASILLRNKNFNFPFKLPKSFVALSLAHKVFKDKGTRASLANALYSSFSQSQLQALVKHFGHESY